jgi:catechol 2,3-dioxygenase-like lactoylglutathione lyase family enzyme
MGGRAIVMSSQPVSCRHAPAVSRHQPRELDLRNRRRQIVADAALVLKELSGHHGADRVASPVFGPGVTAPITVEAGDRVGATWLQLTTDHIAITHVGQYPHIAAHPASRCPRPPGPAVRHTPVTAGADGAGMRAGSRRARLWAVQRAGRPGRIDSVSVQLNHTIVSCRDQQRSAAFLTGILGLPAATRFGHFLVVEADNGVSLDFAETSREIASQHYAFLVGEDEFDAAFGRIRDQELPYWADPGQTQRGAINHRDGGRGVYFEDPDGHLLEILTRPYGSGS